MCENFIVIFFFVPDLYMLCMIVQSRYVISSCIASQLLKNFTSLVTCTLRTKAFVSPLDACLLDYWMCLYANHKVSRIYCYCYQVYNVISIAELCSLRLSNDAEIRKLVWMASGNWLSVSIPSEFFVLVFVDLAFKVYIALWTSITTATATVAATTTATMQQLHYDDELQHYR